MGKERSWFLSLDFGINCLVLNIKGLVYIIWTNTLFLISPQISEISKFINGEQVSITALSTISDQEKIKKVTDVFHFEIYCTHSRGDCYQEIIWSNLSVYL